MISFLPENVPVNDYLVSVQIRVSRIGYYTLNEDLTIASNTDKRTMIQQDMVISPRFSLRGTDDMFRIVLTWGRTPKDMDSYLITPWPRGQDCDYGMVRWLITYLYILLLFCIFSGLFCNLAHYAIRLENKQHVIIIIIIIVIIINICFPIVQRGKIDRVQEV